MSKSRILKGKFNLMKRKTKMAGLFASVLMLGLMLTPFNAEAWRGKWDVNIEVDGDVAYFKATCKYSLFVKECNEGDTFDGFGIAPE
jgi:hypothetical protein